MRHAADADRVHTEHAHQDAAHNAARAARRHAHYTHTHTHRQEGEEADDAVTASTANAVTARAR